jgi:hypothetical protein
MISISDQGEGINEVTKQRLLSGQGVKKQINGCLTMAP